MLSGIVLSKAMENKTGYVVSILSRYPRLMLPALLSCFVSYVIYKFIIVENKVFLSGWFNGLFINSPSLLDVFYYGAIKPFFSTGSLYNNVLWTMRTELIGSIYIYIFSYLSIYNKKYSTILFLLSIPIVYFIDKTMVLGIGCFFFGFVVFKYKYIIKNEYISYLFLLFGLYLAGAHNDSISYEYISYFLGKYTYTLCNFFAAFFIMLSIISNEKIKKVLNHKLLCKLGALSFPIYLLHISVIAIVCNFIYPLLNIEYSSILCVLIIIVLSFIVAIPMSKFDLLAVKISKKTATFIVLSIKNYIFSPSVDI
ncbi:acyltransferase family protein [Photobacterium carnosum]|uniref:acyltransferase family protein n=1 Tax=Photobacterium carnosum TaxID=2023717 RepID=UPI00242B90DB|nr:acyltransferase family protein [Photobacterium carnosum]